MSEGRSFMDRLNELAKYIVGSESYGDCTEFYDEDGVVLVTITAGENDEKMVRLLDQEFAMA